MKYKSGFLILCLVTILFALLPVGLTAQEAASTVDPLKIYQELSWGWDRSMARSAIKTYCPYLRALDGDSASTPRYQGRFNVHDEIWELSLTLSFDGNQIFGKGALSGYEARALVPSRENALAWLEQSWVDLTAYRMANSFERSKKANVNYFQDVLFTLWDTAETNGKAMDLVQTMVVKIGRAHV